MDGAPQESEQWTVEEELMTPSFKLKRPQLQKKYQVCILCHLLCACIHDVHIHYVQ